MSSSWKRYYGFLSTDGKMSVRRMIDQTADTKAYLREDIEFVVDGFRAKHFKEAERKVEQRIMIYKLLKDD